MTMTILITTSPAETFRPSAFMNFCCKRGTRLQRAVSALLVYALSRRTFTNNAGR